MNKNTIKRFVACAAAAIMASSAAVADLRRLNEVARTARSTCKESTATECSAQFSVAGKWTVDVDADGVFAKFDIDPPVRTVVSDERYAEIPVFNPKGMGWKRGMRLKGVRACECSVRFALDISSVSVRTVSGGMELKKDVDWRLDPEWGTIGWTDENAKKRFGAVSVSYAYLTRRIDSVVRHANGRIALKKGLPHVVTPRPPGLSAGEMLLGNIFVDAQTVSIGERNIFPAMEPPLEVAMSATPRAVTLLPRTWAKLNNGEQVTILAWGDSVTDGFFLPVPDKWQEQFARRLRKRFPKADIRLVSNGWSGKKSSTFLSAPLESPYNFERKVAGVMADLVISEFVNDCSLEETIVLRDYPKYLKAFKDAGTEWIIMTPHYVRPDWMQLKACKQTDDDPRPFVKALRIFAAENGIALADASRRWGHLWREGIPFSTLYANDINHPVASGMALFADALMELFGGDGNR